MADIPRELVERIARQYGVSTAESAVIEQYQETISRIARRTPAATPASPADPPPAHRPGTDAYNAFRSRFELTPTGTGPLAEQSLAVKENIAVAGVESTCGSAGFAYTPAQSAAVVDGARAAGAAIVGTTNMDEFGYTPTGETCAHGQVANPTEDGHIPGGSSSGSAAAVAAGLVDVALGTDTAGSVRTPAACCGVVGYKPTRGLLPTSGVVDLAPSLDHVGTLAPDVETAATVTTAIAESTGVTTQSQLPTAWLDNDSTDLRVGVLEAPLRRASEPVCDAITAVRDALSARGVTVESQSVLDLDRAVDATQTLIGTEFATAVANSGVVYGTDSPPEPRLRAAFRALPNAAGLGDHIRRQLLYNGVLTDHFEGRRYGVAQDTRQALQATLHAEFAAVDALLLPTSPIQAPPLGTVDDMAGIRRLLSTTAPFNLTGSPAVSVPWPTADRPVGVQVVAPKHADGTACSLAQTIEAAAPS